LAGKGFPATLAGVYHPPVPDSLANRVLKKILLVFALSASAYAQPQTWAWDDGTVPYVQTPMEIVERMLRMAEVKSGDHVIDLGSGDGRIIIEAAKRGATGFGVDLDPALVKLAGENAKAAGVANRAKFQVMDLFDVDLAPASVRKTRAKRCGISLSSMPPSYKAAKAKCRRFDSGK